MSGPVRTGLIFAGVYAIVKMVFFALGLQYDYFDLLIVINILCVVLSVYLTLRSTPIQQNDTGVPTFLFDLKRTMQAAATYAILVAFFLYVYYSFIDSAYVEMRYEQSMALAREATASAEFELPPNMTTEQYLENMERQARNFVSPFTTSTVTLIGILITGLLYSALLIFLQRKVFQRFRQ